jgi:hypothetical protein
LRDTLYYHHHIFRTGGTTFNRTFSKEIEGSSHIRLSEKGLLILNHDLGREGFQKKFGVVCIKDEIRFLFGHTASTNLVKAISGGRPAVGFSMFREPSAQLVSMYLHHCELRLKRPHSVKEFTDLNSWLKANKISNPQSRCLTQKGFPRKRDIDEALKAIDHVGITEDHSSFMKLAGEVMGVSTNNTIDCHISAGDRPDPPKDMLKYCSLDFYLYDKVLKRLGKVN